MTVLVTAAKAATSSAEEFAGEVGLCPSALPHASRGTAHLHGVQMLKDVERRGPALLRERVLD